MPTTKRWTVEINIGEHGSDTDAEALLRAGDTELRGVGTARRNPSDTNVPKIGDEIAVARALSDLSHKLLHTAAEELEAVISEPVHLRE